MLADRRTDHPFHRDRLSRRARAATAVGAVAAILAVAALIGSTDGGGGSGGADRASGTASGDGVSERSLDGSGSGGGSSGAAAADEESTSAELGDADEAEAAGSDDAARQDAAGSATAPPVEARIIRTGTLDLEVKEGGFEAATARLTTIATNAGGFVSASETSALDDRPRGSLTLRVPVDRFDAVAGEVGEVGDVQAVNTDSQDVTGEYTDVTARLRTLTAERGQIELVLARAENIPDILAVRDRLAVVQGEIEQLQGRQQILDDQTSLSTLTVTLHEAGSPSAVTTAPTERSGFSKLWHDATDRFTDGGRAIALGLASMAPWLLLALVLLLPGRAIWRRLAPAEAEHRPTTGPPAAAG